MRGRAFFCAADAMAGEGDASANDADHTAQKKDPLPFQLRQRSLTNRFVCLSVPSQQGPGVMVSSCWIFSCRNGWSLLLGQLGEKTMTVSVPSSLASWLVVELAQPLCQSCNLARDPNDL
jgi:hypothetical protein